MRDDINVYLLSGNGYCENCFVEQFFNKDREMFEQNIDNDIFVTLSGRRFNIWHDDTVQYESYPHEIIPIEGVFCYTCGMECIAPDESDMRKQRFFFNDEETRNLCSKWCNKHIVLVDLSKDINTDETTQYELTFYTYEALDDDTIKQIVQKFLTSSYSCNEQLY